MTQLLDTVASLASPWAYVVVALLAGLEGAAFLGLVVPGEVVLLLGGVLASTGRVNLPVMIACGVAGAVIGDSVGYAIGRRFGEPLRRSRLGRRISDADWERATEYVRRRGGPAVFFGRFIGLLRTLVPFVAGASRMPYRTFALFNVLGALVWVPSVVGVGFLAGHSYALVENAFGRAELVLGIGVVVLAALVFALRWIIRHPDRGLAPARRVASWPWVARMRGRYASQLDFLADRLNPAAVLGLALTAQLVILAVLGAAFGDITEDVVTGDDLVRLDDPVSVFLIDHRNPALTALMRVSTALGTVFVLVPLLVAVGLLAWRRAGTWRPLVVMAFALAGASLTSTIIKLAVARPRPETNALVTALGFGFPSGHSTAAAAGWLSAALVLSALTRSLVLRISIWMAAFTLVVLVGISRVYLGVHQPTDVLGGWVLGTLWVAAAFTGWYLLSSRQMVSSPVGDVSPPSAPAAPAHASEQRSTLWH